jgi:hypothetical protein
MVIFSFWVGDAIAVFGSVFIITRLSSAFTFYCKWHSLIVNYTITGRPVATR